MLMASSVYYINKGINKPIEFKGLKAQYITYLAVGLVVLLILFAILYVSGVNMWVCVALVAALGTALFMAVYRFNNQYGVHGLTKKLARRSVPGGLVGKSRRLFLDLNVAAKRV